MIEISFVREHKTDAIRSLSKRLDNAEQVVERLLELDEARRNIQQERDSLKAESNQLSKKIGELYRNKKGDKAEELKERSGTIKQKVKKLEKEHGEKKAALQELLADVPNIPHPDVPEGKAEEDNEILYQRGEKPDLPDQVLPHWELADKYDIIDFELGNKITGAGFPMYRNQGAKLQRALINFFLDNAIEAGYMEHEPASLVNEATAFGTGQLPDKEGMMYQVEQDDLYLIPTAEVPLTNIYRDDILSADDFPIKMTAYTPCFRREAGSWGRHVRGLNRLHQFDKVELVQVQHPDRSYDTLEEMREYGEGLLKKLELPYRVAKLCAGDLGSAAAFTYDLEVFAAGQEKWLEVSSISNFETYQANRMNIRFREGDHKKTYLAHTLNGSGLALARVVAALLENNQTGKGIHIPEALQPYTGYKMIT